MVLWWTNSTAFVLLRFQVENQRELVCKFRGYIPANLNMIADTVPTSGIFRWKETFLLFPDYFLWETNPFLTTDFIPHLHFMLLYLSFNNKLQTVDFVGSG